MQKISPTRCSVFLHPAVASNPKLIKKIQLATGLIATVQASKVILKGVAA